MKNIFNLINLLCDKGHFIFRAFLITISLFFTLDVSANEKFTSLIPNDVNRYNFSLITLMPIKEFELLAGQPFLKYPEYELDKYRSTAIILSINKNQEIERYIETVYKVSLCLTSIRTYSYFIEPDKEIVREGFLNFLKTGMKLVYQGTDHLIFFLVLLLPVTLCIKKGHWNEFGGFHRSMLNLFSITSAFIMGQSITLFLGIILGETLPSQLIEIMLAACILICAVHAVKPIFAGKQIFIAAGFGLLHGFAFATAIPSLNLNVLLKITSILGFNIGIVFMQLLITFLIVPWLIIWSLGLKYRYLRFFGAVIAIVSSVGWILQRITCRRNFVTDIMDEGSNYALWILIMLALLSVLFFSMAIMRKTKEN